MAITYQMNLVKLAETFHSEDACRVYLSELRWPDGVQCPRCESKSISTKKSRDQYDCNSCRYQFSVTSGSIFHDSHLPLWKWFLAVYLMMDSRKGISANQLKRMLRVSYKTAWYLCQRIRKALEEEKIKPQLDGTVEVDETFVGGRYDNRRKRGPWEKQAVIGLLQRDGKFEARKIPTRSRQILTGIVRERVEKGSKVFTDELAAYESLSKTHAHDSVNHSAEEWVRGDVHTNSVENAWSLFKRSIVGAFHQVSEKHLDAYLDEFEWRFNNRSNPFLFRDTLRRLVSSRAVPFEKLVA
ncbi:MAG: IS1595 family transposase [Acidobacteria bacterium]|nr:IS1595 family transposase [Acidobacteriota bacterium]